MFFNQNLHFFLFYFWKISQILGFISFFMPHLSNSRFFKVKWQFCIKLHPSNLNFNLLMNIKLLLICQWPLKFSSILEYNFLFIKYLHLRLKDTFKQMKLLKRYSNKTLNVVYIQLNSDLIIWKVINNSCFSNIKNMNIL